jgi:hypothetical protein
VNKTAVAMAAMNLMVLACLLFMEVWALIHPRRGDTISEGQWAIWRLMGDAHWWGRIPLLIVFSWCGYHLCLSDDAGLNWKAEVIALAGCLVWVLAVWAVFKR